MYSFQGKQQTDAKNSNFDIFKRALYLKSMSLPLRSKNYDSFMACFMHKLVFRNLTLVLKITTTNLTSANEIISPVT